jgi:hypothetical protein
LKDLRDQSARFMKLLDLSEAEEQLEERRARRRSPHPRSRGSRSGTSSSYFSYTSSGSGSRRVGSEEHVSEKDPVEIEERVFVRRIPSATNSEIHAKSTNMEDRATVVEESRTFADCRDNSRSRRRSQRIPDRILRRSTTDRRTRQRSRAVNDAIMIQENIVRRSSRRNQRWTGGKAISRNVARLETDEESSESTGTTHSDNEIADVDGEESSESNSRHSLRPTHSNEPVRRRLKGYNTETVEYASFPHPDLCEQLFGRTSGFRGEGDKDTYYPHLKEKGVLFARDERCSFTFDLASLTNKDDGYDCFSGGFRGGGSKSVLLAEIERVERFSDELRSKGGFFFFRESYLSDKDFRNKVYNGKHVIRCRDNRRHALPKLSGKGRQFSGEFPIVVPKDELAQIAHAHLGYQEMVYQAQQYRLREDVIGVSNTSGALSRPGSLSSLYGPLEPDVTYHYKGTPRTDYNKGQPTGFETSGGPGPDTIEMEGREVYQDPHITAPWRRLWYADASSLQTDKFTNLDSVLTGLSRITLVSPPLTRLSFPLFERERKIDRGDSLYTRSDMSSDEEEGFDNDRDDFFNDSILEHLGYKQLSFRKASRRRIVKFQFSWYEIIAHGESEDRKFSGRLYQDKDKRSIQLQSFMVSNHSSRAKTTRLLTDRSGNWSLAKD